MSELDEMMIDTDERQRTVTLEEVLFVRITYEFMKMQRINKEKDQHFLDFLVYLDTLVPSFEDYIEIFKIILNQQPADRQLLSEWIKFSLQIGVEDEVTRINIVTFMYTYIADIEHSFSDYMHLLKYK